MPRRRQSRRRGGQPFVEGEVQSESMFPAASEQSAAPSLNGGRRGRSRRRSRSQGGRRRSRSRSQGGRRRSRSRSQGGRRRSRSRSQGGRRTRRRGGTCMLGGRRRSRGGRRTRRHR